MSGSLQDVAELVRRRTGVAVKEAQLPALAAAIGRVERGLDAEGFLAAVNGSRAALLNRLVDEVTVQETYFFRELRDLEAIDWRQLLARSRERGGGGGVRVWVTACATGEEAYSMAILATEALGAEGGAVTILATDVSDAALRRAAAGTGYSQRSVRNLPAALRDRYLAREQGGYRVRDRLRSMVRFRHHNLVADPSPPPGEVPFDLVACRNVLIYFDSPTIERVLRSLESALRPEGELLLGVADRLSGTSGAIARAVAGVSEERRRRPPRQRALRRPLGLGTPRRRSEDRIEDALIAADDGDLEAALAIVGSLLEQHPMMADALFVKGLVELESGAPRAALVSLRRCLYVDHSFGLAAFQLGRVYDELGNASAGRRAYEQALRTLDPEDERHRAILDQVDLGDVAAACAARLRGGGGGLG